MRAEIGAVSKANGWVSTLTFLPLLAFEISVSNTKLLNILF